MNNKRETLAMSKLYKTLLLLAVVVGPIYWLMFTDDGKWAVAHDLRRVTLQDLLSLPRFCLPSIGGEGWPSDQRLAEALDAAHRALDTPLGVPVVQFVATPDHPMRLTSA